MAALDSGFVKHAQKRLYTGIFNTIGATKRDRTMYEFGYSFDAMRNGNNIFTPFPEIVESICVEALARLSEATGEALPPAADFTNCIISHYKAGQSLPLHIDIGKEQTTQRGKQLGFYFGEQVIGIVLQADEKGNFFIQQAKDGKLPIYNAEEALPLPEEDGSIFILQGAGRFAPYYHGVTPVKNERISLTFRTVEFR